MAGGRAPGKTKQPQALEEKGRRIAGCPESKEKPPLKGPIVGAALLAAPGV